MFGKLFDDRWRIVRQGIAFDQHAAIEQWVCRKHRTAAMLDPHQRRNETNSCIIVQAETLDQQQQRRARSRAGDDR